jgi:phosphopantothenoylcysteine synthetase/decarboxylase
MPPAGNTGHKSFYRLQAGNYGLSFCRSPTADYFTMEEKPVARHDTAYLIISGTSASPAVAEALVAGLAARFPRVITIATPNAARTVSPWALSQLPGNQLVESFFDTAILPRPAEGLVLVAPCGFNSLNKLAAGIADNLALSVAAEAIGRGTPVVVGIACNGPLWRHPRAQESAATLRRWGVSAIDPVAEGDHRRIAPIEDLFAAVDRALEAK